MFGLLVLIALGAAFFFIVPSIIPPNYRSAVTGNLARVVGVVFILFARRVDLLRVCAGRPCRPSVPRLRRRPADRRPHHRGGRRERPAGPDLHARLPRPLLNVLYNVDTGKEELNVPQGKVAILTARDGAPLRSGQAFADPFPTKLGYQMLDAATFISNGGQRGPQLTVLTPGKWRINRYLWDVAEVDAKEVKAGFVGVVKSNVHADIDFGTLKAAKPDNCDVIVNKDVSAGRLDAPIVPVGCIGVWNKSLPPGKYYFNPDAFLITEIDTRAQVWTYAGGYKRSTSR